MGSSPLSHFSSPIIYAFLKCKTYIYSVKFLPTVACILSPFCCVSFSYSFAPFIFTYISQATDSSLSSLDSR